MNRRADAPRDLLFGLLALQSGLIDQGSLFGAFHAWATDHGQTMAQILERQGAINPSRLAIVDGLVAEHARAIGIEPQVTVYPETRVGEPEKDDPLSTASFEDAGQISVSSRYRIIRHHARGGLGVVFVALDTELNREVALKQLLDHHSDNPSSRSRFLIEAEVTGGLEHPGIVPVYGLGHDEAGRPYYAMRLIRGDTLKDAIAQLHGEAAVKDDPGARSLALRKLLRRLLDACNAIDYAHGRGVLHRDIKPSNILVGKHGETLVVDWGLAKAVGRKDDTPADERTLVPISANGSAETLPGLAIGTPAFMSPEQATGDLDRIGVASDVYSLGVTLHSLLTGRIPFDGSVEEVLKAVERGEFKPPRAIDRKIPPALEAISLKAMALNPLDRYDSARALGEDIERWMANEPVAARPEPIAERLGRAMRRHRTAMTATAAALVVASIGLVLALLIQTQVNRVLRESNVRENRANLELLQANDRISKINGDLSESSRREQERFEFVMKAIKVYREDLNNDVSFRSSIFDELRAKINAHSMDLYCKLAEQMSGLHDPRSLRRRAKVAYNLSGLYIQDGNLEKASEINRETLVSRRALIRGRDQDAELVFELAQSLIANAYMQARNNQVGDSKASCSEARSLLERLAHAGSPDSRHLDGLAYIDELMAELLARDGDLAEALLAQQRSKAARETLYEKEPSNFIYQDGLIRSCNWIGGFLLKSDRATEAVSYFERVLAVQQSRAAAHPAEPGIHSAILRTKEAIAVALEKSGRKKEADLVRNEANVNRKEGGVAGESFAGYGGTMGSGLGGFGSGAASAFSMIGD